MTSGLILIPFGSRKPPVRVLEYGLSLAQMSDAHTQVWHISYDPHYMAIPYIVYDVPVYAKTAKKAINKINKTNADLAQEKYKATLKKMNIETSRVSFHQETGLVYEIMPSLGKTADLVVATLPNKGIDKDEGERETAEACLFTSGHPIVFVPAEKGPRAYNGNALIAWNDSPQAVRAVTAALPYLKHGKIRILVNHNKENRESLMRSTGHLVEYLKCHNVAAEIIAISKKDTDFPETLLNIAEKMDAGMIVMGAYTHTRFRESILGGVTSHLLQYANRPIFMSH